MMKEQKTPVRITNTNTDIVTPKLSFVQLCLTAAERISVITCQEMDAHAYRDFQPQTPTTSLTVDHSELIKQIMPGD